MISELAGDMPPTFQRCPAETLLTAFLAGDLNDEQCLGIFAHLETCEACQGIVRQRDERDTSFQGLLAETQGVQLAPVDEARSCRLVECVLAEGSYFSSHEPDLQILPVDSSDSLIRTIPDPSNSSVGLLRSFSAELAVLVICLSITAGLGMYAFSIVRNQWGDRQRNVSENISPVSPELKPSEGSADMLRSRRRKENSSRSWPAAVSLESRQLLSSTVGAPPDPGIGGGANYTGKITNFTGFITVTSLAELKTALTNAAGTGNKNIYIAETATIDLSGETASLQVAAGVTLASNRGIGTSLGALITCNTRNNNTPLFAVAGNNVRFSGFRLQGPNQFIEDVNVSSTNNNWTRGISSTDRTGLVIDNMDLSHFGWAGIYLSGDGVVGGSAATGTFSATIKNNSIHHMLHSAVGYGVVLYGDSKALIDRNLFNANRHSIAGHGDVGEEYTASNNIVLAQANSHQFDMHALSDAGGTNTTAGSRIEIINNTFLGSWEAVKIRGIPTISATINNNLVVNRLTATEAFVQSILGVVQTPSQYQHFTVGTGNAYGSAQNEFIYGDFESGSLPLQKASNDVFWVCPTGPGNTKKWYVSIDGVQPWKYLGNSAASLTELRLADLNGDGIDDVFNRTSFQVSWGGTTSWVTLTNKTYNSITPINVFTGDFDGDGKDEVFALYQAVGQTTRDFIAWEWSSGVTGSWRLLKAGQAAADYWILDADSDGKSDVVRKNSTNNGLEFLSGGNAASWATYVSRPAWWGSTYAHGDFNGDGNDDLFRQSGGQWQYSTDNGATWIYLNTSGLGVASLVFGDFDGDGYTDVLSAQSNGTGGYDWKVSWRGKSGWKTINSSGYTINQLLVGAFSRTGAVDIATVSGGLNVSYQSMSRWYYSFPPQLPGGTAN